MNRFLTTMAAVTVLSIASGCSSDSNSSATKPAASPATSVAVSPTAKTFNDADAMFARGALAHHQQAVELAEIALDPRAAAREEIKALSTAIVSPSPDFEAIEQMIASEGLTKEMSKDEMTSMAGMASETDIKDLETLTGADFDKRWLTTLIAHHEGAIKMAKSVIDNGQSPQLDTIANKLLGDRSKELELMKSLLG
jgi:uncharacterized protein (DUF305 family)